MSLKECNYFIEIIRNVLHNKKTEYNDKIDYKQVYEIAKYHSLEAFMYEGCKDMDLGEISKALKNEHKETIYKVAIQEAEKEALLDELEKAEIKHMPLKGAILKYLYPSVELRSMADFDCFFDKTKKKDVKKLLISLGYDVELYNRGNHDVYMKKPYMSIEMHKDLIGDCFKISKYYKNVWNNLILVDGKKYEYKFNDEDFYIFMIAHMVKHFAHGGTGIRSFIDIYLYINKFTKLDFNYINEELNKMGIVKFSNKAIELSKVWFDGEESNELMDNFAENVFTNGTYGTIFNSAIVSFNENSEDKSIESSKSKYFFRRMFPTFETMKRRNPILKKLPILLPWFYMIRLFKGLFTFKGHKQEMDNVNQITKEDIEKVNKLHEELGVKNKI